MKLFIFKLIGFIQHREPAVGYTPPKTEYLPGFNQWTQEVFLKRP